MRLRDDDGSDHNDNDGDNNNNNNNDNDNNVFILSPFVHGPERRRRVLNRVQGVEIDHRLVHRVPLFEEAGALVFDVVDFEFF